VRQETPGELALHPVVVGCLVVLVVNDRWLKSAWPGFVTGKLSDAAGLVLLPVALLSLVEVARRLAGRELAWRHDPLVWVGVTVVGFVFVKVTPAGHDAYAWAIGALRWPFHGASGPVRPIAVARDAGDLIALLVAPVPYLLIRRRTRNPGRMVVLG
jgi:hypothetical protein